MTWSVAWSWVKKHPWVLFAVAALAVALLSLSIWKPPARETERAETTAAVVARSRATEHREEKRAVVRRAQVERYDPATGALVERRIERERELSGVTAAIEQAAQVEARAATSVEHLVERERASLRLRLDAGWSRLAPRPDVWGGAVEVRLLGPVWVGAGYGTDRVARLSVAWEF